MLVHSKAYKVLVGNIVHGAIQLQCTAKFIWIRGQCTPCGTQVERQIFAVPIRNMALASKDYAGVRYTVAIQKIHRIV